MSSDNKIDKSDNSIQVAASIVARATIRDYGFMLGCGFVSFSLCIWDLD